MKSKTINWRNVAENMWGRGGTTAYKTNRKGAYYYSCSGHGGYIVPLSSLTEQEIAAIESSGLVKQDSQPVLMGPDGVCYGVDYGYNATYCSGRTRKFYCKPGSQWQDVKFYAFEEDCDWAVLETLTSVRVVKGSTMNEQDRLEHARKTVERLKEWRDRREAGGAQ